MDNRYSRQLLYKNIGRDGQRLLGEKTAVIVGLGALGSLSSEMLARAGIGKLILVDRDYVEVTNSSARRCIPSRMQQHKTKSGSSPCRASKINSNIDIESHIAHCDAVLLESLAKDADIIIDGTDNFDTRMLINDASFRWGFRIAAACVEASYSSAAFIPGETPCFRCLTPVLPAAVDVRHCGDYLAGSPYGSESASYNSP